MKYRIGTAVLSPAPQAALAHGTLAGGGRFYAGLAHPVPAWERAILLVGPGTLPRGHDRLEAGIPLWTVLSGLGAEVACGPSVGLSSAGMAMPLLAILAGAALVLRLPVAVAAVLAFGAGPVAALDTGVPPPPGMTTIALAWIATRPLFTIAVRMAGSWIIAIALMVPALHPRQSRGAA